jgi:hypothetical protein
MAHLTGEVIAELSVKDKDAPEGLQAGQDRSALASLTAATASGE